jgi:hypothetical protein
MMSRKGCKKKEVAENPNVNMISGEACNKKN